MPRNMASSRITSTYPVQLHFLKALFLDGHYRRCVQTCRDLLRHTADTLDHQPLRRTFINFYLALSHDELARAMHPSSIARLPALTSSEQAFIAALEALPSPEEVRMWWFGDGFRVDEDPFVRDDSDNSMLHQIHSPTFTERYAMSTSSSPILSPTPARASSSSTRLAEPLTHGHFEDDDTESEVSFSGIVTPSKVLQRDFSRMSLLDGSATQANRLPREVSRLSLLDTPNPTTQPAPTTKGLMRKNFQFPTPVSLGNSPSKLPRMADRAKTQPLLQTSRPSRAPSPDPVSPISNVGGRRWSEASTVSAISARPSLSEERADSAASLSYNTTAEEKRYLLFLSQIDGMREQLSRHITLVQKTKQETQERVKAKTTRLAPTTGTPLGPIKKDNFSSPAQVTSPLHSSTAVQRARSYWSFVPENIKESEKKRRIENGRERKWERKRFDPSRYRDLCEKELAELCGRTTSARSMWFAECKEDSQNR